MQTLCKICVLENYNINEIKIVENYIQKEIVINPATISRIEPTLYETDIDFQPVHDLTFLDGAVFLITDKEFNRMLDEKIIEC